ncbi:MAG: glycosyltransferase family 9 protein [Candidatus Goldbacteria bacterium]|nr:glycosyltransferase family 9 protein [Candidatus Goldiibacteriota bacterium]
MKILLIRLSSTGDIILISPVVKFLKNNVHVGRVDLLVREKFESAAELTGADRILKLKTSSSFTDDFILLNKMVERINWEKYDVVVDLHSNFRTFFIRLFSKSRIKSVIKKDFLKRRLMVVFKWFIGQHKSVEEKYFDAAKKALYKAGTTKITIPDTGGMKTNRKKSGKIVIHAGAKWPLKRWPYFSELARKISKIKGVKLYITGVKEEIEKNDELLYIKSKNIVNLTGKTTFKELAMTIKSSDLFIGNDTAAAHLAGLYNVPAVVIMGPTVPEFGFITDKKFFIVERKLSCRPCSLHGGNKCPIGTFECMAGITPEMLFSIVKKRLKR